VNVQIERVLEVGKDINAGDDRGVRPCAGRASNCFECILEMIACQAEVYLRPRRRIIEVEGRSLAVDSVTIQSIGTGDQRRCLYDRGECDSGGEV
jgi:hypothetical protein